jgi:tetratricopeptide (TPR) repeat protein
VRRWAIVLLLALPLFAQQPQWPDYYKRGVESVRAGRYAGGAEDLKRAIAEMPTENGALRARNEIITYVPHFWLGIARFNLGEYDAALREWKTSEEQGVVQSTPYFGQLRDWISRAQAQKRREAESSAADSRKAADTAISRALSGQMEAVAAGGDRNETYRSARRKLQEALDVFNHAGTNITAYRRAADTASLARELFSTAAEEAKKAKASRAATPPPPRVQKPAPHEVVATATIPFDAPKPTPPPVVVAPPAPAVESEAFVSARLALQKYRRHLLESGGASQARPFQKYVHDSLQETYRLEHRLNGKPSEEEIRRVGDQVAIKDRELIAQVEKVRKPAVAVAAAPPPPPAPRETRAELESAYRAFATGDFDTAEALLTKLLGTKPEAPAYALRGCARYTRAMLSRRANLATATADFRAARRLDPRVRLDTAAFSPKLVKYFDSVR